MKAMCARCDEEHDLDSMDPGFDLPDEAFAVSRAERTLRVKRGKDFCRLEGDLKLPHYYLRTLLEVQVSGRLQPVRWGIWVEVNWHTFDEVMRLWSDDARLNAGPWRASLANTIPGFAETLGLTGTLRFNNLNHITYLTLDDGDHQLIQDQRQGVSAARAVEWLLNVIHSHGGATS